MMNFEQWREHARDLIHKQVLPNHASWQAVDNSNLDLFTAPQMRETLFASTNAQVNAQVNTQSKNFRVPAEFMEMAPYVFAYRSDDTQGLLYRILWRILNGEPHLLKISIDSDTIDFHSRYRLVKRDMHKIKAFVRFREVNDHFIAWHRPDHLCLRLVAPFFVERFNGMTWSILTSDECMHWDQKTLTFSEGVPKSAAPSEDSAEELWLTYYKSIFNPARIKWNAMTKEMPVRHWKTLPETAAIQELLRTSPERLQKFYRDQNPDASKWLPILEKGEAMSLERLSHAIPECNACGICEKATGPVMGEGPLDAEIAFIGEQPGEEEDRLGRPFIGPAGQLLDRALTEIGIQREALYITNAVKAFKYTEQENYGRIHRGSSPAEIAACNPWLKEELKIIKPKKIVCLGRSAAQAILGKSVIMRDVRGQFFKTAYSDQTLVVPHPSFILRIQNSSEKLHEYARFVQELRLITQVA